jgi:hypothetical protein
MSAFRKQLKLIDLLRKQKVSPQNIHSLYVQSIALYYVYVFFIIINNLYYLRVAICMQVHTEAAQLLQFTEDEFVRTLDWNL